MEKNEAMEGYTEEEFQSLLALMGLSSLFGMTRGSRVWEDRTPEERFLIIETYRRAIADREKMTGYTHERMVGNTRSVNAKY